ncbi:MAG: type I-U CRISPR-associated protein Cas7 [Actinobacteria bacterium]|nr:type I-U CRISPR-associated protein Cas7 [Actinomycetota bacterium]
MGVQELTYEGLRKAMEGKAYAFRAVVDLLPAGGSGDKVFPPTYQGSVYAREKRIVDGEEVNCVLLDSVQSQANRLELALLDWHRSVTSGERPFPLVQIDFTGTEVDEVGVFTVLEAPHRIADAIFFASEIEEDGKRVPFRHPRDKKKSSKIGRLVDEASLADATGLFGLCPTALIFGMWDSHGARGGLGEKFQRVLTSEIIGVSATDDNKRPTSRIDPLIRVAGESLPININEDKTWALAEGTTGRNSQKLSKVGLGNVTPSLIDKDTGAYNHGGVSIRFARQIAVLSLPALRRLRFPTSTDGAEVAARTTLAALALAALSKQWEDGFSLRSRCDLVPKEEPKLTLIYPGGEEDFHLTFGRADEILRQAVRDAKEKGLPWPTGDDDEPWNKGILTLKPNENLVKVVARSRELASEQKGEEA